MPKQSFLKNKALLLDLEEALASAAAFTSCPAALNAPCAASRKNTDCKTKKIAFCGAPFGAENLRFSEPFL